MVRARVLAPPLHRFHRAFDRLRSELEIPASYPHDALDEAHVAMPDTNTDRATTAVRDATDIAFVTVDPPGSLDLDQAFHAEPVRDGVRVRYAIADPGGFVRPGGALDTETRRRGVTMYAPDHNTPLHPRILGEQHASLLAGRTRPAVLWTVDVDGEGEVTSATVERATVRSRRQLTYRQAQALIDAGTDPVLGLLRDVGTTRAALEVERDAVSIDLPDQEVVASAGGYDVRYDTSLPVESWNAQISLLVGMIAGERMADAELGLLRTLPPPRPDDLEEIRRHGLGLGVDWPPGVGYATRVRGLDPSVPAHAALLSVAVRALRGAGYLALPDRDTPLDERRHWAIGGLYAHVTAPLRRIGDRFANEILLAQQADRAAPTWAVEALDELPDVLAGARRREGALERGVVDVVEALVLEPRIGEEFEAVVTSRRGRDRVVVQLADPAVVATIDADAEPGTEVRVRLSAADPGQGRVSFEIVATTG